MRDIQLSELTYVAGGISSSNPSKKEIETNARWWGVFGGISGGLAGFAICASAPPNLWSSVEQQGFAGIIVSGLGAVLGYGVCYGIDYGINSHIYQV